MNHYTIYTLPIHLDKALVFARQHIHVSMPNYDAFDKAFDELTEEINVHCTPRGMFTLKPICKEARLTKDLSEVSHVVYAMVTLGPWISSRSTAYFKEKDFLKGLLLDAMADQLLFDASDAFYPTIRQIVYDEQGYALTVRIEPDDRYVPMWVQKLVLDECGGRGALDMDITDGYMYNPLKTMGYLYGADKNIAIAEKDHDCDLCSNLTCEFRKAGPEGTVMESRPFI